MRIIANQIIENIVFEEASIPPETIKNYTKRKMVGAIANELLKYPHLFKETQSERPFDNTKFEIAIVMLRMDTVRDIGIILRDHSYLNDYWKKQIQYLFNEKL